MKLKILYDIVVRLGEYIIHHLWGYLMTKRLMILFLGMCMTPGSFAMMSRSRSVCDKVRGFTRPAVDAVAERSGPVMGRLAQHKGKLATGLYIVYSATWYAGVAGLTYQADQVNKNNQRLATINERLQEQREIDKKRIADLEKRQADFVRQHEIEFKSFTDRIAALERAIKDTKEK